MDYSLNTQDFEKNFLDIGTGDGRYVYKSALNNPNHLYIGIDPSANLKEYQREINRKRLKNAVLLNSSIENFNPKISEYFDEITIILPWGNLLKYVVTVDIEFFTKIAKWLKPGGLITIIFGFNEELEERITKRLNLPELTDKEIQTIKNNYLNLKKLKVKEFRESFYSELGILDTSWAKKLSFGKNRKYLYLKLEKP